MPRIVGVDIPDRKKLRYALRYIHGIGPKFADEILEKTGIDPNKKGMELTENEVATLSSLLDSEFVVEGALR
ncbi:MAG: 30S ribosomal protein S13, partial [Planctomycetota bacterium]